MNLSNVILVSALLVFSVSATPNSVPTKASQIAKRRGISRRSVVGGLNTYRCSDAQSNTIRSLTSTASRWCRETSFGLALRNEDIEFDLGNMLPNLQARYRSIILERLVAIWAGIIFENYGLELLCDNHRRACKNEFHDEISLSHPLRNAIYLVSNLPIF